MASRRRFANFLDNYLQHYLIRKDQENQSSLIRDRQMELADAQAADRLMELIGKDPAIAARARAQGVSKVGGLPIGLFARGDNEYAAPISKRIADAKTLADLPVDQDIESEYFAQPGVDRTNRTPIEALIAERKSRDEYLRKNMAPVAVDRYNPTTRTKEKQFLPGDPGLLTNQTVQTDPTPEQAGENAGLTLQAQTPFQIASANKTERETRGEKVRTAGATAAVTATAQQNALTKGEGDRIRQAWELAAQDPAIAASASAVLQDPTAIKNIDAKSRKYVYAALQSSGFKTAAQRMTLSTIEKAEKALDALDPLSPTYSGGFEGAIGAKGLSSLFGLKNEPIGGTKAAGYSGQVNQLINALTLPALEVMRGLGHMSDKEFGAVASSVTMLSRQLPEKVFLRELENIKQNLAIARQRAGLPPRETPGGSGGSTSASQPNDPAMSGRAKLQSRRQLP